MTDDFVNPLLNRVNMPFVTWKTDNLPLDDEGTNAPSAEMGDRLVCIYQVLTGTERATALGDLLNDLMHLCDRDPGLGSFKDGLETGMWHYTESIKPIPLQPPITPRKKSGPGIKRKKG